jgi:predicted nuclease of predicted toxin-antitoxin system
MATPPSAVRVRLLLDAHYSPKVAEQLTARGHDAVAAAADTTLRRLPDRELFAYAVAERRALVTNDVADFIPLAQQAAAAGEHHCGLVLTSDRSLPRSKRGIGRLVRALDGLGDVPGDSVLWLG